MPNCSHPISTCRSSPASSSSFSGEIKITLTKIYTGAQHSIVGAVIDISSTLEPARSSVLGVPVARL